LMRAVLLENSEARGWTCREWEKAIDRKKSAIHDSDTWKSMQEVREIVKATKAAEKANLKRSQRVNRSHR